MSTYHLTSKTDASSNPNVAKINATADGNLFPNVVDLFPAAIYFLVISLSRLLLQSLLLKPLANKAMKLQSTKFQKIQAIEKILNSKEEKDKSRKSSGMCVTSKSANKNIENFLISTLSLQSTSQGNCSLNKSKIRSYLRQRRRNLYNNRKVTKFVEAVWRCLLYTASTLLGTIGLFYPNKAVWIKDSKHYFIDWPNHTLSSILQTYYQIQIGSYLHQLLWTEVSRSDAIEMIIHHIVTLALLLISYWTNFTRIGTSILLLHDTSDVFLETAKIFNYISKSRQFQHWTKRCCDVLFVIFAVSFFVTRMVIFPRYLIYSVMVDSVTVFGDRWNDFLNFCWYLFSGLLLSLQVLHLLWFYTIMKMVLKLLTTGIESDERSDDEEEDENTDDDEDDENNDDEDAGSNCVAKNDACNNKLLRKGKYINRYENFKRK